MFPAVPVIDLSTAFVLLAIVVGIFGFTVALMGAVRVVEALTARVLDGRGEQEPRRRSPASA